MIPPAILEGLKEKARAGIQARNPNKGPAWWNARNKIFERQWPLYVAYLGKWVDNPPKNAKAASAGPWDFFTWQETRREHYDDDGGGLAGKFKKAVATPIAGPLSFLAGPLGAAVAPLLAGAAGAGAGSLAVGGGKVASTLGLAIPTATHGLQLTTAEGRAALTQELALYGAVAGAFAPAIAGIGITAGAAGVSSLNKSTMPAAAAAPPIDGKGQGLPMLPILVLFGLVVVVLLAT